MSIKQIGICVLLLSSFIFINGETVTSTSSAFSFPVPQSGIKTPLDRANNIFFTCTPNLSGSKDIKISWSLPEDASKDGKISFYNLSGRCLKTFNIKEQIGVITWKFSERRIASGVYFAKIKCGSFNRNLKIALFN